MYNFSSCKVNVLLIYKMLNDIINFPEIQKETGWLVLTFYTRSKLLYINHFTESYSFNKHKSWKLWFCNRFKDFDYEFKFQFLYLSC